MELSAEEALSGDYTFVDFRSEKEYGLSHIPFAHSLPLLDDEAREIVGIAYKQKSRQEAIDLGLEHVLPKLEQMLEEIDKLLEEKELVFYCSRGGMRSSSMYKILAKRSGVHILKGGYKAYRRFLLENLGPEIKKREHLVFQGYTGVGKTALLLGLEDSYEVLDLEGLANHRGSVFGGLGASQPSQKQFQNDLFNFYLKSGNLVLLESESSRIGRLILPKEVREKILSSPIFLIEAPLDYRVNFLVEDYGVELKKNKDQLLEDIWRLKKQIGNKACYKLEELLLEDRMAEAIELLLINYYDPLYQHSLRKSQSRVVAKFDSSQEAVLEEIGRKIDEILYS